MDELIQRQQEEIAVLRERVAQLEEALAASEPLPVEWRLTPHEARMYTHLRARPFATKESLMMALYSERLEQPEIKIVDVFVCKMRRKLRPFGITIRTIWGQGYALERVPS